MKAKFFLMNGATRFEMWVDKNNINNVEGLIYIHQLNSPELNVKYQLRGTQRFKIKYVQVISEETAKKMEDLFVCYEVTASEFAKLLKTHKFDSKMVTREISSKIDTGWRI